MCGVRASPRGCLPGRGGSGGRCSSALQVPVDGLTGHAQELGDLRHRHVSLLQPPGHVAPDLRQEGLPQLAHPGPDLRGEFCRVCHIRDCTGWCSSRQMLPGGARAALFDDCSTKEFTSDPSGQGTELTAYGAHGLRLGPNIRPARMPTCWPRAGPSSGWG